jgi:hypothetical protein
MGAGQVGKQLSMIWREARDANSGQSKTNKQRRAYSSVIVAENIDSIGFRRHFPYCRPGAGA